MQRVRYRAQPSPHSFGDHPELRPGGRVSGHRRPGGRGADAYEASCSARPPLRLVDPRAGVTPADLRGALEELVAPWSWPVRLGESISLTPKQSIVLSDWLEGRPTPHDDAGSRSDESEVRSELGIHGRAQGLLVVIPRHRELREEAIASPLGKVEDSVRELYNRLLTPELKALLPLFAAGLSQKEIRERLGWPQGKTQRLMRQLRSRLGSTQRQHRAIIRASLAGAVDRRAIDRAIQLDAATDSREVSTRDKAAVAQLFDERRPLRKGYPESLMRKLGARNTGHAVARGIAREWITREQLLDALDLPEDLQRLESYAWILESPLYREILTRLAAGQIAQEIAQVGSLKVTLGEVELAIARMSEMMRCGTVERTVAIGVALSLVDERLWLTVDRPYLQPRDISLLRLEANGAREELKAAAAGVPPSTFRSEMDVVRSALGAGTRTSATLRAWRLGLVEDDLFRATPGIDEGRVEAEYRSLVGVDDLWMLVQLALHRTRKEIGGVLGIPQDHVNGAEIAFRIGAPDVPTALVRAHLLGMLPERALPSAS